MFHSNTRRVIADWQELRADRLAPARSDIAPEDFREVLPQLFILGGDSPATDCFRLAGGLLVDLHARDLRGASFLSLWPYPDRTRVADALKIAHADGRAMVLEASAWTSDGCEVGLEIVLAPLIGASGTIDRVLGLYQPTSSLRALFRRPIQELTLRNIKLEPAAARRAPALRLAARDGERLV